MKKKSGSKAKWALWLLIIAAFACILAVPLKQSVPKLHWRAPVQVSMPKMPTVPKSLPGLGDLPKTMPGLPSMPKIGMADVEKLGSRVEHKVEDMLPEIPPFLYEASPKGEQGEAPAVVEEPPVPSRPPEHGKGARIAIIIDDMGLVQALSERAVKLPGKITLSYLPYAQHLQEQAEKAAAAGHDLMLHMPMEPIGGENPGPHALFTGQSEDEWKNNLDWALSSFDGYIGVNNHMGSKFTADNRAMAFVAQILKAKGVFFIDSRTGSKSVAEKVAREMGMRSAGRDVFLDDTPSAPAVRAELLHAEKVARQKGHAIVIGHPHAVTLIELEKWLPEAQARGYEIVPVRTLVE